MVRQFPTHISIASLQILRGARGFWYWNMPQQGRPLEDEGENSIRFRLIWYNDIQIKVYLHKWQPKISLNEVSNNARIVSNRKTLFRFLLHLNDILKYSEHQTEVFFYYFKILYNISSILYLTFSQHHKKQKHCSIWMPVQQLLKRQSPSRNKEFSIWVWALVVF